VKGKYFKEVVPTIPRDLVSVAEAAEISGVTRPTIWRKVRSGQLRAWGVRRCYRVSISELLAPVAVRGGVNE
jgi:excisionase family DNA binding protein